MIRKKIDDKIQILFKNSISRNERSMFLIIGDKGRDQISNLHNFYSQLNPFDNNIWCDNSCDNVDIRWSVDEYVDISNVIALFFSS